MRDHEKGRKGTPNRGQRRQLRVFRRSSAVQIVALAAVVNVSAASLLAAAPSVQRMDRRVANTAATTRGGSRKCASCVGGPAPGGIVTRVRGGSREDGDADEPHTSSLAGGEGGSLAVKLKEIISRLLEVIGSWLGISIDSSYTGKNGKSGNKAESKRTKRRKSEQKRGSVGGGFKESFEANYGDSHPKFCEKSFADATEHAWARNRLCLVYIPGDRGGGRKAVKVDDDICKALADSKVSAFVDSNLVLWVPGGKSAAQRSAAAAVAVRRLGVRSLPFLGVVSSASTTDKLSLERKLTRSTVALHHCNPAPSSAQMISWMSRVLDLNKGLLETESAVQQKLKDEEIIHIERIQGYSESLKDDALRELREREEEAERARLEEEKEKEREASEAKEGRDMKRRERKSLELGQEPPKLGEDVATLMLRLSDGSRVRRRFLRSDTMGKVLDWADVQGVDLEAQRLSSSSAPKATFSHPREAAMTIEEAGLGKQALLIVEQKPLLV